MPAEYAQITGHRSDSDPDSSLRCDRFSCLGNPFVAKFKSSDGAAVRAYHGWITELLAIDSADPALFRRVGRASAERLAIEFDVVADALRAGRTAYEAIDRIESGELSDLTLMCWCEPHATCHVQCVLIPIVNGLDVWIPPRSDLDG